MMKTLRKLLALSLVVVLLLSALAACGANTLSGTYETEAFGSSVSYTFKGDKVTLTISVLGTIAATVDGTYEIDDGTITLTFAEDEEKAEGYGGTFEFSKDEENDSIKIGLFTYEKVD